MTLPTADADKLRERPGEIIVAVAARRPLRRSTSRAVDGRSVELLAAALAAAAAGPQRTRCVIISADALATHQAVINVLDAARRAGLPRLTFAAQTATRRQTPG